MRTSITNRSVVFFVQDGCLVRIVAGRAGETGGNDRTYTQRCGQQVFEAVAHALNQTPREGAGTSVDRLARQEKLPFTQVNIALEFLKERGIVEVRHRHCYPATQDIYLDAMVEFHALAEEGKFV